MRVVVIDLTRDLRKVVALANDMHPSPRRSCAGSGCVPGRESPGKTVKIEHFHPIGTRLSRGGNGRRPGGLERRNHKFLPDPKRTLVFNRSTVGLEDARILHLIAPPVVLAGNCYKRITGLDLVHLLSGDSLRPPLTSGSPADLFNLWHWNDWREMSVRR